MLLLYSEQEAVKCAPAHNLKNAIGEGGRKEKQRERLRIQTKRVLASLT